MNSQFDTVIDSKSDIGHMIRLTKNYVLRQTGNVMDLAVVPVFSPQTCCSLPPGVQPYKYGGKELDRTGGLDAYDFGARSYFADRLQWSTMDPLCEKYYDVTPYGYCLNDPVKFFDPDGRRVDDVYYNEIGNELYRVEKDGPDNYYVIRTTKKTSEIYKDASLTQKGWSNPISNDDAFIAEVSLMNGDITGEHIKMWLIYSIPAKSTEC